MAQDGTPNMPSWRIAPHYSPLVLLGNWQEERQKNEKPPGVPTASSTYRFDYKRFGPEWQPDCIVRRKTELANAGLDKQQIFGHHGNQYSNNMISWYDEDYNHRPREGPNKLPELRSFSTTCMGWTPERRDYPIQGDPTNYGLRESLSKRWGTQVATAGADSYDLDTTYGTSYLSWPDNTYKDSRRLLLERGTAHYPTQELPSANIRVPRTAVASESRPAAPAAEDMTTTYGDTYITLPNSAYMEARRLKEQSAALKQSQTGGSIRKPRTCQKTTGVYSSTGACTAGRSQPMLHCA